MVYPPFLEYSSSEVLVKVLEYWLGFHFEGGSHNLNFSFLSAVRLKKKPSHLLFYLAP